MILNTPQISTIGVFDANYKHDIDIIYEGVQIYKTRAIIRNNTTNEIIYDITKDGFNHVHTISDNALKNGIAYNVQIQVFDADNNGSNLSSVVVFRCYTTPVFEFTGLNKGDENDNMVYSANFTCNLTFEQKEGDTIKECKYYLYDGNKSLLHESDSYYSIKKPYTYYNLQNVTEYNVKVVGTTLYGFHIDTGFVKIKIKYDRVPTNVAFKAENKEGKIILSSNIVSIDYTLDNDSYTLANGEFTLLHNTIEYHVTDPTLHDFTFILKARNIPLDSTFLHIKGNGGDMKLSIYEISDITYCKLAVTTPLESYVCYQKIEGYLLGDTEGRFVVNTEEEALRTSIQAYDPSILTIYEVHRKNNLYSINAYYL